MTHKEKINYMRIAASIAGFGIQNHDLDLLVSIYEKVTEKEGKTSIHDISDVEYEVEKRTKEQKTEEKKKNKE